MSANGRRRWRKALRSRRKRGVVGPTWGPPTKLRANQGEPIWPAGGLAVAFLRRHRRSFHTEGGHAIGEFVKPLPPAPWSARSLVGMSMGARKRKYAKVVQAVTALLNGRLASPDRLRMLRSLYRIGERLRPCPNCMKCWPWTEMLLGDLVAALAPPKGAPRRFRHLELDDLCDGSGVIAKGSADV